MKTVSELIFLSQPLEHTKLFLQKCWVSAFRRCISFINNWGGSRTHGCSCFHGCQATVMKSECVSEGMRVHMRRNHSKIQIHTDYDPCSLLKFTESSWNYFLSLCGGSRFRSYQSLRGAVEVTWIPVFLGEIVIRYST